MILHISCRFVSAQQSHLNQRLSKRIGPYAEHFNCIHLQAVCDLLDANCSYLLTVNRRIYDYSIPLFFCSGLKIKNQAKKSNFNFLIIICSIIHNT
ncbi:hypothetical protein BpHYR1_030300 [Brachionus plicatilis]|uniref:Uncharacterized protein n=1 Tax=Brachionus plicatilis TaxID=10195 RepID=A0A3M7PMY1_BRAPC|nr:hypothetical protein BpHYR1_030300 [Brachionus plicatilis]